jgi:hypothetical protein
VTTRDFPQEYQQQLKKKRGSARISAPDEPSAEAAQSSRAKRRAEALEMGSAIEAAGEMDEEAAMDVDKGELVVLGEEGILRTKAAIRAGMDRVAAEEDESLLTFIGLEPEGIHSFFLLLIFAFLIRTPPISMGRAEGGHPAARKLYECRGGARRAAGESAH